VTKVATTKVAAVDLLAPFVHTSISTSFTCMSMSMSMSLDEDEFPSDALLGTCLATPDDPGVFPEKTAQELQVEERRRTSRFIRMLMTARRGARPNVNRPG
jgi:hypothetical protein